MRTFCPPGGRVLDPFAGTLTTGIAGIQSGRPCVLLETDSRCLSLGIERLKNLARAEIEETLKKTTVVEVIGENHQFDANDSNMNESPSNSHEQLNVESETEEQVDLPGGDPGPSYSNEDNRSDESTTQENITTNSARHQETSEPKLKKRKGSKAPKPSAGPASRSRPRRDRRVNPRYE